MPVPNATYIAELDPNRPLGTEDLREGDDWLRLITSVLQNTFPTANSALPIASWAAKDAGNVTKTASYLLETGDDGKTIIVNAAGGPVDITLPNPALFNAFRCAIVKNDVSTNAVTIVGDASDKTNYQLEEQWAAIELYSTGAAWMIVGASSSFLDGLPGAVLAYDADGDLKKVGPGVVGQVLQSQGPNLPPIWGSGIPTGVYVPYIALVAPEGWILARGLTIGNTGSGATERADPDCEALFKLLWEGTTDTFAPVTGGRGASADDDWLANKIIAVRDPRGRVLTGIDNMGAGAAGHITGASFLGENASQVGGTFGLETHTLTYSQMPVHAHTVPEGGPLGSATGYRTGAAQWSRGPQTTSNAGGGLPHSNTAPGLADPVIMKL